MSFQDIKAQDKPIQILKGYIKHSRLTGSYLFTGEEGVGKKLVAKTLAKALNCEGQTLDSCDSCVPCLKIEKGQHPDIHIIEGSVSPGVNLEPGQRTAAQDSDSIKIEYIRQLQKDINLKPYEGKKKVFIIDNAHNLTAEAANALLKILEEPPGDSLIILLSAKPVLLFKTIISRCKTIKFYPLPRIELEEILKKDFHLDSNLAHYLAYSCEGRIGRALKLKDIDILREKNSIIDAFTLVRRSDSDRLSVENRNNVRAHLNILAGWFRDMYLIKIGAPYSELINLDRKEELLRLMHRYTFMDLYEIFNSFSSSLLYLEHNINVKLLLSNLREDISYGALYRK
jgi:DNA polymerase-3 subunit delta'